MSDHLHSEKGHSSGENAACGDPDGGNVPEGGTAGNFPEIKFTFSLSGFFLLLIWGYKKIVSPWLPRACRFTPTCSAYAAEAIMTHGAFKGTALTVWRLLRCQPFCRGGWDPVPPRKTAQK